MSKVFEYFKIIGLLKQVDRTGWVRCKVRNPESVAEHMYRMAMMSWALPSNTQLDRDKCMKIALVHDMAESIVGDITPWCGVSKENKQKMEGEANEEICSLVGDEVGKEMYNLWMEYETQSSPEAQFVKDLDKFEMLVQAYEYEQRDNKPGSLQGFFDHTKSKYNFSTDLVRSWCDELIEKRHAFINGKSAESSSAVEQPLVVNTQITVETVSRPTAKSEVESVPLPALKRGMEDKGELRQAKMMKGTSGSI